MLNDFLSCKSYLKNVLVHVNHKLKKNGLIAIIKKVYVIFVYNDSKAPVTPNGDATAFVQRSKTMSARCGIAAEYTYK